MEHCDRTSLGIHQHSSSCYDAENHLICGYADFVVHHHDENCYDADGSLWCTLPEIEEHQHNASCYDTQEREETIEQPQKVLVCTLTEGEEHQHTEDCYETQMVQSTQIVTESVLTCEKSEVEVHQHTDDCYELHTNANGEEEKVLVCDKQVVLAHQHTEECSQAQSTAQTQAPLICTNQNPNHTHTKLCYGTWVLTCGMPEHTHTKACLASNSSLRADNNATAAQGGATAEAQDNRDPNVGKLNVTLLYGDGKEQTEYEDGFGYYPRSTMSGFIRMEPQGLDDNMHDFDVTLTIPKQYVEKDSIKIPTFSTNSETKYVIRTVEEDDTNYSITVHFTVFDKSQKIQFPFTLSFLDELTPDNYRLNVTATLTYQDEKTTTTPNVYKPLYHPWFIDKFVNSNKSEAFAKDGAEVVVTPEDEDGNPYLGDTTYVHFAFRVNNVRNLTSNLNDYRDCSQVTLTDTLPTYIDIHGKERIAVFEEEKNPGWTLSADGKTITKTYVSDGADNNGKESPSVLTKIYQDEVLLKFPDLPLQEDSRTVGETSYPFLYADLKNDVQLSAVPSSEQAGETRPTAEDSLKFRITTAPYAKGSFSKVRDKGNIYDDIYYKGSSYPWRLTLSNDNIKPLEHIVIQDRKIVNEETGNVDVKGLDEALKFDSLELNGMSDSMTVTDVLDKIVAYYTDGELQEYLISEHLTSNGFQVTFDESRVCNGFDIVFQDDYAMKTGQSISFRMYTTFRDPENTHVPSGKDKVTYDNQARSVNSYPIKGGTGYTFLISQSAFDMLPSVENLFLDKGTYDNEIRNTVGSTYRYMIGISGAMLEGKEYQDLRVVDLLPEGVEFVGMDGFGKYYPYEPILQGKYNYVPEIVENYHNSGRTAVIFHLNTKDLSKIMANDYNRTHFLFKVRITEDAKPGKIRNYAYIVGDNLDEYRGKGNTATQDIYDLNNNGRTDDIIAYAYSDATIVAAESIYAEKLISFADRGNWTKQGLAMKAGTDFDYLLRITNETSDTHTGLTLYDVLPQIGDKNIFAKDDRGSDFRVQLRKAITPPDGYTVYYTTSDRVYNESMQSLLNLSGLWTTDVADYTTVTAFKLVANEGVTLDGKSKFEAVIPAKIPEIFSEESMARLDDKQDEDQNTGTVRYLEAINSFGYKTDTDVPKSSNNVSVRVAFAGFSIKKIDAKNGAGLPGAEFTLTDSKGNVVDTVVSDAEGMLQFRNLTEGEYTLTETKIPNAFTALNTTFPVSIKQNAITMEYTVTIEGTLKGVGTQADPFQIENYSTPEMPATGGIGTTIYYVLGASLTLLALLLLLSKKRMTKQ